MYCIFSCCLYCCVIALFVPRCDYFYLYCTYLVVLVSFSDHHHYHHHHHYHIYCYLFSFSQFLNCIANGSKAQQSYYIEWDCGGGSPHSWCVQRTSTWFLINYVKYFCLFLIMQWVSTQRQEMLTRRPTPDLSSIVSRFDVVFTVLFI